MPCRSGSPQPVRDPWGVALPTGATFSRTMTARITPTTPSTDSSRFLISTSVRVTATHANYARGRLVSRTTLPRPRRPQRRFPPQSTQRRFCLSTKVAKDCTFSRWSLWRIRLRVLRGDSSDHDLRHDAGRKELLRL